MTTHAARITVTEKESGRNTTADALVNTASPEDVQILFLDVGQGHATLLIDHAIAQAILVDCPAGAESVVTDALAAARASLHTGIITHFDRDHSTGLITLFENTGFPLLIMDPASAQGKSDLSQHRAILRTHRRFGYTVDNQSAGQLGRVSWKRIGPALTTQLSGSVASNRNRLSLCLLFEISPNEDTAAIRRLLITGDADHISWKALLDNGVPQCNFLLWPHHGARLGTTRKDLASEVLHHIQPELVVISAGSLNQYHHPSPATVTAVTKAGIRLACTQATPHCHSTISTNADPACAGTISVRIDSAGAVTTLPDPATHRGVIATWDKPLCSSAARGGERR